MSVRSIMTDIADNIRRLTGTTDVMGLDAIKATLAAIVKRTANDLTASGASVTVPAGYYASNVVKAVKTATQVTPSISVSASGLITASATQEAGYVPDGTKSATKQLTAQAAQTITPGTSSKTIASGRYLTGTQTIKGDSNLVAGNIKKGVSIFGVTGTHVGGVTVQRKEGVISFNGATAQVNVGFKPDIVVFTGNYIKFSDGTQGINGAAVCFSGESAIHAIVRYADTDGEIHKITIQLHSTGFFVTYHQIYSESSGIWVNATANLPYVALKYT